MKSYRISIGTSKSKPIIIIYFNNLRHRYWNGKVIGVDLKSEDNPTLLKAAFELRLRDGWRPQKKKTKIKQAPITVIEALQKGVEVKIKQGCSERFIKDAKRIVTLWRRYESEQQVKNLTLKDLQSSHIRNFLVRPNWSAKTQRTVKSTLSPLLNEFKPHLVQSVKLKKPTSTLHKPFDNINEILEAIKVYNKKHGCLLRPHREIRELTWSDFSEDLSYIRLSGNRNKSGRLRIVPVPIYVRELLVQGEPHHNIFSNKPQPYNEEYFKTLWSRFKKQSKTLEGKDKHCTLLGTLEL